MTLEPGFPSEPAEGIMVESAPALPRVPHFGHVLLFLALSVTLILMAQALVLVAAGSIDSADKMLAAVQNQRLQLATMALGYVATLAVSWLLFSRLWERPFLTGIQWNENTAKRYGWRLVLLGFVVGVAVQAAETRITMPNSIPMDDFFKNASVVWALTIFGTLLAPMFEEIAFRGFLFPSLAIAWDWMRLNRADDSYLRWRSTETLSTPAILVAGFISSAVFALIHAAQLGYTWSAVALLMAVSLVLTWVRVSLDSVAASTIVHACYNLSVFITLMVTTGGYRHLDRITR